MKPSRVHLAIFAFTLTLLSELFLLFLPNHRINTLPGTTFLLPPGLFGIPPRCLAPDTRPDSSQQTTLSDRLSDKVLRLHIIADSDSEEAQAVKLLVRDAVCNYLSPLPDGIDSKEKVCDYLNRHRNDLVSVADEVLQQNHCTYRASASIERRFFPLKTYGSYAFPAGEYDALCITLGSGQGQNWWCLAFPSLCLLDGTYAVTDSDSEQQLKILLTDEEYEAILIQEPKIQFRFRLLEWLKGKHK